MVYVSMYDGVTSMGRHMGCVTLGPKIKIRNAIKLQIQITRYDWFGYFVLSDVDRFGRGSLCII